MSFLDYFDFDWHDDDGYFETVVTCKFCGRTGLQWQTSHHAYPNKPRFFLVDNRNRVHNCRVSTPDEFEDLTHDAASSSSIPAERNPVNRPGNSAGARKQTEGRVSRSVRNAPKCAQQAR